MSEKPCKFCDSFGIHDPKCPAIPFAIDGYEDEPVGDRACGACGEPEGSVYAKRCCTSDNMIEA